MELFECILDGNINGKYDTNHFNLVIADNITLPVWELDNKKKGTFMHEYLHYIQHLTTPYGLCISNVYNNYFNFCKEYLNSQEEISIPLDILRRNEAIHNFNENFKKIKGSNTNIELLISDIEIPTPELIEVAVRERKSISIGIYDFETGEISSFDFGYCCIIESMAHIFQSFFDNETQHPDIPYNSVKIVCKKIYPEIVDDPKKLISLCLCSMASDNPGAFFFKIINFAKENSTLNGLELYQLMLDHCTINVNGSRKKIKHFIIDHLENIETNLINLVGTNLEYYSEVFSHCKEEINRNSNILLDILYNEDITSDSSIQTLLSIYGIPFIEMNDFTITPFNQDTGKCYVDTAGIKGSQMIIQRLIPPIDYTRNPPFVKECPKINECLKTQYLEENKRVTMTEECLDKQWNRNDQCFMKAAFEHWSLKDKTFLQ